MPIINKIILSIDNLLDTLVPYYIYFIYSFHIVYVVTFIGLLNFNASYLSYLNIFIQLFICLFLILRFNPFRNHNFKESDSNVIFGSATFLLLNLGLVEIFKQSVSNDIWHVAKNIDRTI
jgi:hypothetical protein